MTEKNLKRSKLLIKYPTTTYATFQNTIPLLYCSISLYTCVYTFRRNTTMFWLIYLKITIPLVLRRHKHLLTPRDNYVYHTV
jgi:hypothetical protein